jgi:2-desacetyl-2-hydroxyethyl bacteriochlorophyllide A dehydrogenase
METMKAVRLKEIGKPLVMQDIPVPTPSPTEALVRIKASGICHSDVHMWAGQHPVAFTPITLGHEIAGVVEAVGDMVDAVWIGQRVCLHYVVGCGKCYYCRQGREMLCPNANFLGPTLNGGFAEFISIPALNLVPLPLEIPFEHGAVLMCSGATSYHSLRRGHLQAGECVAIFGTGGVGMSLVQLARAFGANPVFAVDIQEDKLQAAQQYGAVPVNANKVDPVSEIKRLTEGQGVDVALGIVGLAKTMEQAVKSVRSGGRAIIVGMADQDMKVQPMGDIVVKEVEILGSVDHSYNELLQVVEFARQGILDLSGVVKRTIPLEAQAINDTFIALDQFGSAVRTVICPD